MTEYVVISACDVHSLIRKRFLFVKNFATVLDPSMRKKPADNCTEQFYYLKELRKLIIPRLSQFSCVG